MNPICGAPDLSLRVCLPSLPQRHGLHLNETAPPDDANKAKRIALFRSVETSRCRTPQPVTCNFFTSPVFVLVPDLTRWAGGRAHNNAGEETKYGGPTLFFLTLMDVLEALFFRSRR